MIVEDPCIKTMEFRLDGNMNEKIAELAEQCIERIQLGFAIQETYFNREKFAELIVRECAEVLDKHIAPPSHPMNSLGTKVKQHFGVEP